MSFDALLVYEAEVLKRTVTGNDPDDGVEEVEFISSGTFPCWIEPLLSRQGGLDVKEYQQARDTVTGEWRLLCNIGVDIEAYDQVLSEGRTFEVTGPPETARSPRGPHHIEANLRWIEG